MSLESAKQTFIQEAADLLVAMEDALLSLEESPDDADHLHQVFRAMHTIKGTAGVFGYDPVVNFTHTVETLMDEVRSGAVALDSDLIAVLFDCRDHTAKLVDAATDAEDGAALDPALEAEGDALIARLAPRLSTSDDAAERGQDDAAEASASTNGGDHNWVISLQFRPDALRNGMDPLSFIRYLQTMGEIIAVFPNIDTLSDLETFDPESCYLGFRIIFNCETDKKSIENVFEFAEDDCDIAILPPSSEIEHYLRLLDELSDTEVKRTGEILVQIGALTPKELSRALTQQAVEQIQEDESDDDSQTPDTRPIGSILVEQSSISEPVLDAALRKQEKSREKATKESQFIRIDAARLGHLIDLVGELVIHNAAMKVMVKRHGIDDVDEVVGSVDHLVEEIRDNALQLRMVQIGDTFSRFRRVVRDVSRDLDKDIDLVINGGDTELDKTVVDKINDPLTHLVRNALDHGIERNDQRLAKGKPARGKVELSAHHDSGHIVIEIKDDGAGLDPEKILGKAKALGLVRPEQTLSRREILQLIFEPGLSTKDQASDLSGRGVGMDVVRRNIEGLRGTVELDSIQDQGTTVTIVLPLTLAIIDGFLVGTGTDQYVIPLAQVVECVEIGHEADVERQDCHYISLRGEVLPYLRLRDFFGTGDNSRSERESLVVVRFGHSKAGLVVDELYGELQTVIKPLGQIFERLKGVAGATVLGTGDIALILDVAELTSMLHRESSQHPALATQ